jgi:alkylation response protein AidB-like acyl-CoA dehydrogenase
MNFAFSDEQEEFRGVLRRFLEERWPIAEVFRWMETPAGYDPALWKQMALELGLQGVQLPERYGGQGFGLLELGIVMEETGRALLCAPYFSSVCLAANAILEVASEEQKTALLPGIASGETIATLALLDAGDAWDPAAVELEFRRDGDACVLEGAKRLVTDGASAALILVAARQRGSRGRDGVTLLAVRSDQPGLSAAPVEALDATRKLADLRFEGVRAACLGGEGAAADGLTTALDRARVCLAAESAGGAQHCLDSAVSYAAERVQFGRPIGSFQAIKHRCAEVLLEVESARSAASWACWTADEDPGGLALAASVAKSFCGDAYQRAAAENLHIHGGVGFTWEADPHLYLKRARAAATLLGSPAWHRTRIAECKGF